MEVINVLWKSGQKSETHTQPVSVTLCPAATSLTGCWCIC